MQKAMEQMSIKLGNVLSDVVGLSGNSLLQLVGELGPDFADKFDTAQKFCRWCNLVPNNRVSGGRLISSRVPGRKNPVGQVFRLCANTLWRSRSPPGFYFRRVRSRAGHMSAIVATAHKMARMFYTMVRQKTEYDEGLAGPDELELLRKKAERAKKNYEHLLLKCCNPVDCNAVI